MKRQTTNGPRTLGGLDFTPFSPDLATVLGSEKAALLMGELERSFGKKHAPGKDRWKGSIYKHVERATGDGDALEARTHMGRKAIDAAMGLIAVTYRSPKEYDVFKDAPFTKRLPDGTTVDMPYARVVDPANHCTRIFRNKARVDQILADANAVMRARRGEVEPEMEGSESVSDDRSETVVQPDAAPSQDTYDPYDDPAPEPMIQPKDAAPQDAYDPYDDPATDPTPVRKAPVSPDSFDPYDIE